MRWLSTPLLLRLHERVLAASGGTGGVLSEALLDSALHRPQHRAEYEPGTDLFDLAASYAFGLIKDHPFLDGNKRTGVLAIRAFLFRNGSEFKPDDDDAVRMAVAVAMDEADEVALAAWIRRNAQPR